MESKRNYHSSSDVEMGPPESSYHSSNDVENEMEIPSESIQRLRIALFKAANRLKRGKKQKRKGGRHARH